MRCKLCVIGHGGCTYYGPEDGGEGWLTSYQTTPEVKYLLEGAVVVNYLTADYGRLARWSISGPMVDPNIDTDNPVGEISPWAEEVVDNYLGTGTYRASKRPGFMALDTLPLDKWLRMMRHNLPDAQVGKVVDGEVVWEEKPTRPEPKQRQLFQEAADGHH